jgi:hypothetical protein
VARHPTPLLAVGCNITPISGTAGARRTPFRTLSATAPTNYDHPVSSSDSHRPDVQALLDKGAVSVVEDHSSPCFYSYVFLVPKKSGGVASDYRPVPSKPLPQGTEVQDGDNSVGCNGDSAQVLRFKMETTRSVATAIQPKDWAVSLDLRDAYFYIPMHPDYQHFLRFSHEGKLYQSPGSAFRTGFGPSDFHNCRQGLHGFVPHSGAKAPFLPR